MLDCLIIDFEKVCSGLLGKRGSAYQTLILRCEKHYSSYFQFQYTLMKT